MESVIFREYDIRGIVGSQLKIEQVYDLGRAIAVLFTQLEPSTKTIAVGMDGRSHSAAIKQELVRGLIDSGLNVVFIGVCPTPVLYYAQYSMPVDAGLMITASHNPADYNGIKLCLNKKPVWGAHLKTLHQLTVEQAHVTSEACGTITEIDGTAAYIDFLVNHFAHLRGRDVKVIFDCANAVGGLVIPELIKRFEWRNAQALFAELDATFPNHEPDPVVEANMVELRREVLSAYKPTSVALRDADGVCGLRPWGIGFDGDCDRMSAMTAQGNLVPGDQLTAIFSKEILAQHPGATVVYDVRSSSLLEAMITVYGGKPHMSACGHAIIKEVLHKQKALLAGELSCHFCFADRYYGYDDGIYAALRLIELLLNAQVDLDALVSTLPRMWNTPEIRIACAEEHKRAMVDEVKKYFSKRSDAVLHTIDGVRVQLANGWGLVRASNTQAVLSLRFEAKSADALQEIREEFATLLLPYLDADALKQIGLPMLPRRAYMNGYQL